MSRRRIIRHRRTGRVVSASVLTSYHEAGHVVASLALGLSVTAAGIASNDGDGFTEHGPAVDWLMAGAANRSMSPKRLSKKRRREAVRHIDVALAGHQAEVLLLGGHASQQWTGRDYSDRLDAEDAARMLGRSRGYVTSRRAAVRRLLAERWRAVVAVARALRQRTRVWAFREVKGRELRAIARAAREGSR